MRALKYFLIALLLTLAAAGLGLYLAAQPLAGHLTSRAVLMVNSKLAAARIESRISIERTRFELPMRVVCSGFTTAGRVPRSDRMGQSWDVHLNIETAGIGLKDLPAQIFLLTMNNLMLRLQPNSIQDHDAFGYGPIDLYIRSLEIPLQIRFFGADRGREDILKTLENLHKLIQSGQTSLPLNFEGKLFFKIEEQPVELVIRAKNEGEYTRLLLARDDLMKIGDMTEDGLTAAEADLLASHPVDVPKLLTLQHYVSRISKKAGFEDPRIPEDAYRHVLWSYLLTKSFGPDFSKQVTDAHEDGVNKKLNTAADHAMDYNNNRVGRNYAANGVAENEILWKILSDPQVIKTSSDPRANFV